MRKIILTFFSITLVIFALSFLFLFNFKFILQPQKLKDIVDASGIYSLVAGIVRDDFVKETNLDLSSDSSLEVLNSAINPAVIKIMIDDFIDQSFTIINQKTTNKTVTIDYSPIVNEFNSQSNTQVTVKNNPDDTINLSLDKSPLFKILVNFDLILIIVALGALLSALMIVVLSIGNRQRFLFLGFSLLVVFVIFFVSGLKALFLIDYPALLPRFGYVWDVKIINTIKRVVQIIISDLTGKFILESIILLGASIGLIIAGRSIREDKIKIEIAKKAIK